MAPRYLARLDGARDFDFTDLCANPMVKLGFVGELGDACSDDATGAHNATEGLVTAALDRCLACDSDAYLDDSVATMLPGVSNFDADREAAIGVSTLPSGSLGR